MNEALVGFYTCQNDRKYVNICMFENKIEFCGMHSYNANITIEALKALKRE